jgi:O-succinylbenzoic acid--CoA ligase
MAIRAGEAQWNFAELDQQASSLARQLATVGVQAGNRVVLLAANSAAYVACTHALTRLGAILVPLNTRLTLQELCWQIRTVRATLLLSDTRHAPAATAIIQTMPELASARLTMTDSFTIQLVTTVTHVSTQLTKALPATDISLRTMIDLNAIQAIMYTSGTTGQPKGVMITYGMQWWNALGSALNLGHSPDDCWLACLPFFHIGGLSILMRSVIYGISILIHEKFDPLAINQAICEERVTLLSVVAVMLQRMLAALDIDAHYPSTLRCVLLGGGPTARALLEHCIFRHIPVVQTYGLTESCSQAVTLSPTDTLRKPGSAGHPLLPLQLRIMHDGQEVAPGEPGVICLKGPTITPGYADQPEATAQVLHDGWLTTGDMGYLDEEGYLYVLDRRADLIVSGGENVYPAEIEAVLLSHADVEEAGVCGQDDPQWGQVPVAFLHLRAGSQSNPATILAYARERLARYKLPKAIYFVDQLPRNAAGKLVRHELPRLLPAQKPVKT